MRTLATRALASAIVLALIAAQAAASSPVEAITDNIAYNVGSVVELRLAFALSEAASPAAMDIKVSVRYAGESKALLDRYPFASELVISKARPMTEYRRLWQIPVSARTGRYEIDFVGQDAKSHQSIFNEPSAASFVVYKKLVRIESIKLDRTFYTSGDPVSADFTLSNLTRGQLSGLRVEFANRYWPWIAGPADAAKASVVTLAENLSLGPGEKRPLHAPRVEVADVVKQPSTHQYGVVVWDRARKNVLDIAFSPLAFFYPPGVTQPRPYPGQYVYPNLSAVNPAAYRQFFPLGSPSAAIRFDHGHTMFPAGSGVTAPFTVTNPTRSAWKRVSIRYRIVGPGGDQLSQETAAGSIDLAPGESSARFEPHFATSPDSSGIYRVLAEVIPQAGTSGDSLASEALEIAVNPMPKSILILCAHEDDEGGYSGLARAAIENHVPIHYVYFTSGDAGSCDTYYQHSCGAAEALNFGRLRMDEVRASLGHLSVPPEDILFVGLPDGGSGQIWYDHVDPASPFLDPLLATDHAPYEGLVAPNLPFARDSVVETAKALIRKFQPELIATPHPGAVGHIDHIVDNYFVVKAIQALAREGAVSPSLPVLVDRVRDPKTQPRTPYHYKDVMFYVSEDAAELAQEAGWFYLSQGGSRQQVNIKPLEKLPRQEEFRQILDWNEHEGWNDKRERANP